MPASWDEIQVESQTRLVLWVRCSRCGYQSEPITDAAAVEAARVAHWYLHQLQAGTIRARLAAQEEGGP